MATLNKDDETLSTWDLLNEVVRVADEATCRRLLKAEMAGKRRQQFVLRIHSRLNRMRAAKERQDLTYALLKHKEIPPWL